MRKLFAVARLNLIEILHSKEVYISGLLMPIVLTFLFSMAFGGAAGEKTYAEKVGILDLSSESLSLSQSASLSQPVSQPATQPSSQIPSQPQSQLTTKSLSEALVSVLEKSPDLKVIYVKDAEEMNKMVLDENVAFGAIIPNDFDVRLKNGEKAIIDLVKLKEGPPTPGQLAFMNLLDRLDASVSAAKKAVWLYKSGEGAGKEAVQTEEIWAQVEAKVFAQLASPPVETQVEEARTGKKEQDILPSNYYSSIGFMLMFISMVTVGNLSSSLIKEREEGTLVRLMTCPVSFWSILGGKGVATYLTGLVQSVVLIGFGIVLGVPWSINVWGVIPMVMGFLFAMSGMGILIGALAKTRTQAGVVSSLITVVGSMIGGCWWPLEIVPGPLRTAAMLTPYGWGVTGLTNVIGRGYSVGQILPQGALLLAFGILVTALGVRKIEKWV